MVGANLSDTEIRQIVERILGATGNGIANEAHLRIRDHLTMEDFDRVLSFVSFVSNIREPVHRHTQHFHRFFNMWTLCHCSPSTFEHSMRRAMRIFKSMAHRCFRVCVYVHARRPAVLGSLVLRIVGV